MDINAFEKLKNAVQFISFGKAITHNNNNERLFKKQELQSLIPVKRINLELTIEGSIESYPYNNEKKTNLFERKLCRLMGNTQINYTSWDSLDLQRESFREPQVLSPTIVSENKIAVSKKKRKKQRVKFTFKKSEKTTNEMEHPPKCEENKCKNDFHLPYDEKKKKVNKNRNMRNHTKVSEFSRHIKKGHCVDLPLMPIHYRRFKHPNCSACNGRPTSSSIATLIEKEKLITPMKFDGIGSRRSSLKGISSEVVQGTSILKQDIMNEWVKEVMREGFEPHGVGCRYRRPSNLPFFAQEDYCAKGPIYFGVLKGLYVGNFRDSKDQQQLTEHGITHILSIHDNARKLPCNNDKEYLCIIASDSPGQNLTQFFPVCNDFIHNARLKGGSVLIHCLAGMSRSVTVAVVYVMCVTHLNWRDSLKAVQGARNVANPNVGFMKQLQEFEKERLHDERRRLREKYSDKSLVEEDEQMSTELLACYYHYISVGEMCEGNCHPGVVCPRGLCHTSRSMGIFRRNSGRDPLGANIGLGTLHRTPSVREAPTSNLVPGSLHRTASSPASMSPECSPEGSRNPSPSRSPSVVHKTIASQMLTPPASPSRQYRKLNVGNSSSCSTEVTQESPSSNRKFSGSGYGQPTPPGSPSRSFRYYTEPNTPSPLSSPSASFNRVSSSKSLSESPSRTYCNGKVIHCPSHTPPASPMKSCRKRSVNISQLTPPESPLHFLRNKNKFLQEVGQFSKFGNTPMPPRSKENKGSLSGSSGTASSLTTTLKQNITLKKYKFYQRDAKSLDLSTHEENTSAANNSISGQLQSVPASPNKQRSDSKQKGSPSRFCQVVTRLLPHLKSLNSSSKLCKHDRKQPSTKSHVSLYVDKEGRSTLISTSDNLSPGYSQEGKVNVIQENISISESNVCEADTQVGIFKVCSNIQKLRKDSRPDLELDLGNGNELYANKDIDASSKTSEVTNNSNNLELKSSAANIPNTNIIINPIFNLESKYITNSLCNEPFKTNDKKISSCTAFLKDDIIYIETTENNLFSKERNGYSNKNDCNRKPEKESLNIKKVSENKNIKSKSINKNVKTNLETKNAKINSETKNVKTNWENKETDSMSEDKTIKLSSIEITTKTISDDKNTKIFCMENLHHINIKDDEHKECMNFKPNHDNKNISKASNSLYQPKHSGSGNKCTTDNVFPSHIKTDDVVQDKSNEANKNSIIQSQNDIKTSKEEVSDNCFGKWGYGYVPLITDSEDIISMEKSEENGVCKISHVVDIYKKDLVDSENLEQKIERSENFGMKSHCIPIIEYKENIRTHSRKYEISGTILGPENCVKVNHVLFNNSLADGSNDLDESKDSKMSHQQNYSNVKNNEPMSYQQDLKNASPIWSKTLISKNNSLESETLIKSNAKGSVISKKNYLSTSNKQLEHQQQQKITIQSHLPDENLSLSAFQNVQKLTASVTPLKNASKTTQKSEGSCKSEQKKNISAPKNVKEKISSNFQNNFCNEEKNMSVLLNMSKEDSDRRKLFSHKSLEGSKSLQSFEISKDENEVSANINSFQAQVEQQCNLEKERTKKNLILKSQNVHSNVAKMVLHQDSNTKNIQIIEDEKDVIINVVEAKKERDSMSIISDQTNPGIRIIEQNIDLNDNHRHNEKETNYNIVNCKITEESEILSVTINNELEEEMQLKPASTNKKCETSENGKRASNKNEGSEVNYKEKNHINELTEERKISLALFSSDDNERFHKDCKYKDDKSIKILKNSNFLQPKNKENDEFTNSICKTVKQDTKDKITARCDEGDSELVCSTSQSLVRQGIEDCSECKSKKESIQRFHHNNENEVISKEKQEHLIIKPIVHPSKYANDQSSKQLQTAQIKKIDQVYQVNDHRARPMISSPPPVPPRRDKNPSSIVHATPPPIPPRKGSVPLLPS